MRRVHILTVSASVALSGILLAQTPAFEVVSIKRASWPNDAYFAGFTAASKCGKTTLGIAGNRVTIPKINLCGLIRLAYNVEEFRVAGVPKDLLTADMANYYDIDARAGAAPTADEAREMLKGVLAERFQLKLHHEPREVPVYALVAAGKNAPKLSTQPVCDAPPKFDPEHPMLSVVSCKPETSMAVLATRLTGDLDRPVVDKTGLTGSYAFSVRWEVDGGTKSGPNPNIFTAVQEQLGLKLEPQKQEFDSIVVDQARRASEN